MLEYVVCDGWMAASTTTAALIRKIDAERPTLLLDEVDAMMKGDTERAEAVRGILNAGYRRSCKATTCVGQGAAISTKDWHLFGAKALTGLGGLHDTLASRCIPISLKRRKADETVEKHREREQEAPARALNTQVAAWVVDHFDELVGARPALPDDLSDRAADIWEPLLAIADVVGGSWPSRGRATARHLASGGNGDDDSKGVELLRDIRTVFSDRERIWTSELIAGLLALDEAPWRDLFGGKQLDVAGLGRRLKNYKIKSKDIRIGEPVKKGFEREQFVDAWARYLVPAEPS